MNASAGYAERAEAADARGLSRGRGAGRPRRQRRQGITPGEKRRDADDAPQRQGARVSARLPGRYGRGPIAASRAVATEGAAIDEELRLCYVGVTPRQDRLTMTLSLARMKWGKKRPTIPSRFLFELLGKADRARVPRPKYPRRTRAQRPSAAQSQGRAAAKTGPRQPAPPGRVVRRRPPRAT